MAPATAGELTRQDSSTVVGGLVHAMHNDAITPVTTINRIGVMPVFRP